MKKRILVIDDSMVNRSVAGHNLVNAGFEVENAENGSRAIELLELESKPAKPTFDALLLDIMMPGIDGLELLRQIREVWNEVQLPVIMVTSRDKSEDVLEALNLGANDYVTKPLDPGVLLARLHTHLKLKDYHQSLQRAQHSLMDAARIETVGLLASGVAHEIRNPLSQIQMAVQTLQVMADDFSESSRKDAEQLIETAVNSVAAADRIVAGLIQSFSNETLDLENRDINEIIQATMEYLTPEIQSAGVQLRTDFSETPATAPLAEEEFQQALVAVVRNSIQAMKLSTSGQKVLSIRTSSGIMEELENETGSRTGNRLRKGDPIIEIAIADNGPGMTRAQMESAFDAFYTTKATGAGTGLGLTVARKIIELHKGRIQLQEKADKSTGLQVRIILKSENHHTALV